jgi:hypothetical protein
MASGAATEVPAGLNFSIHPVRGGPVLAYVLESAPIMAIIATPMAAAAAPALLIPDMKLN